MTAGADFPRPVLVVSRCLGFEPVRYNGQIIHDDFVQRLAAFCELVIVCPEVEIGLGVPRPPVRLVRRRSESPALVQPDTGRVLTAEMVAFADRFLSGLPAADGFVLKGRSPTCGLRNAKLYSAADANGPMDKAPGVFGAAVLARFPSAAVDDEGRLRDEALRTRFLTLLFGLARLRGVEASGERAALVEHHARYKYVLMAYDERSLRALGRVVATVAERPWSETISDYRERFARALSRPARVGGHVNALQHMFGPISAGLAQREREFFLAQLEDLRAGHVPLAGSIALLRSWALRFDASYLQHQAYLDPYPSALAG